MSTTTTNTRTKPAAQASNLDEDLTVTGSVPARFISKRAVVDRVGASYPSIWQWMRDGKFPRSRELGGRAAWVESEIEAWIVNRPVRRLKGDP